MARWICDRWHNKSSIKVKALVDELMKEGIQLGYYNRQSKSRSSKLVSIVRSAFIHKQGNINYSRRNTALNYSGELDFLESMGLLKNCIAANDWNSKKSSYFYDFEPLLERFSSIEIPIPKWVTVKVKKKRESWQGKGYKPRSLKLDKIPNSKKLRLLENEVEKLNKHLSHYDVLHPVEREEYPLRYVRIFNGGSFAAKQGGRYYSYHPVFLSRNK